MTERTYDCAIQKIVISIPSFVGISICQGKAWRCYGPCTGVIGYLQNDGGGIRSGRQGERSPIDALLQVPISLIQRGGAAANRS